MATTDPTSTGHIGHAATYMPMALTSLRSVSLKIGLIKHRTASTPKRASNRHNQLMWPRGISAQTLPRVLRHLPAHTPFAPITR